MLRGGGGVEHTVDPRAVHELGVCEVVPQQPGRLVVHDAVRGGAGPRASRDWVSPWRDVLPRRGATLAKILQGEGGPPEGAEPWP